MEKRDSYFGHPKFKGAAEALAKKLKNDLKNDFDTRNINSVNPSYLYRSGKPNALDIRAAEMLGFESINILDENLKEPLFLVLKNMEDDFKPEKYFLKNLTNIEDFHRFTHSILYNSIEFNITAAGRKYLAKILRELPLFEYGL